MEKEGVIKYKLDYTKTESTPLEFSTLNSWRTILHRLKILGQEPGRYQGLGFGNVSQRIDPFDSPTEQRKFIISGTQTGETPTLEREHYSTVLNAIQDENRIVAEGPVAPSSEALTHGMIYDEDNSARFVFHVHSPEIWIKSEQLKLPATHPDAAYGTREMTEEVRRLFRQGLLKEQKIFSMLGHEDGIVSFGETAEEAGQILVRYLALAMAL